MRTSMTVRWTRIAMCAALTAVAAQLAIPLPLTDVPFTLQVFAVILCGLLLGAADGFWSQVVYLAVGAAGAPVFARLSAGPGVLLGFTGGYLLAYPLAAGAAGWLADRLAARRRLTTMGAFLAALPAVALIYAGGALGLQRFLQGDLGAALAQGVLPFVGFDLVKAALAAVVAVRVRAVLVPRPRLEAASQETVEQSDG